jgi:uncharacterized protein
MSELAETPPQAYPTLNVVDIWDVAVVLPSQFPIVTLREVDPPFRELQIPMGMAEGAALAQARGNIDMPRPLTHELFSTVLQRCNIDVIALRVTGRTSGVYLAELDLMAPRGREILACRPSDGLILVTRHPVISPVLADVRLFESTDDVVPA